MRYPLRARTPRRGRVPMAQRRALRRRVVQAAPSTHKIGFWLGR